MIGSGGTFFMAWLGAYDFLAHYARGGYGDVATGGFPEPTADSVVGPAFEGAIQKMVGVYNMERCRRNSTRCTCFSIFR